MSAATLKSRHCSGVVELSQGQTREVHADAAAPDIQHRESSVRPSAGPQQTRLNKTGIPPVLHVFVQGWPQRREIKYLHRQKEGGGKNQTMGKGDVEASGQLV